MSDKAAHRVTRDYSGSKYMFQPLKVGQVEIKHRAVLAPLTRNRTFADGTLDVALAKEYYGQRSKKEGTLIISEGIAINDDHVESLKAMMPGMEFPILSNDKHQHAVKEVIDEVHKNKSSIFVQLVWVKLSANPAELISSFSKEKIDQVVTEHVQSAERAFKAGADGVEVHFANGTLLYQFLNPAVNKRTDEYGGSIENRARLPLEILERLGSKFGYSKISFRLSPFYRLTPDQYVSPFWISQASYVVAEAEQKRLEGKEFAYVSIIEARTNFYGEGDRADYSRFENVDFVPAIYKGVILRSGNFIDDDVKAHEILETHPKTILAFGRYFISNPDLPDRLERGLPLTPYDRSTFYIKGEKGYTDYPFAGK